MDADAPEDEADIPRTDEPADTPPMGTKKQQHPSVDLGSIVDTPEKNGADAAEGTASGDGKADDPAENGGIERLDFAGTLFPASDLLHPEAENSGGGEDDGVDPEYNKALDMVITICGKLHDCTNWTARRILNDRPDVIVDFCHRNSESYDGPKYTGPRVDQKEALFKLYPNAVRKTQKAA